MPHLTAPVGLFLGGVT
uniref:Uncharacterized protein n=1 Tax=Anguilla anguilla TaxID=7936 RepID=A0A0E9U5Q4_ANGAN